MENKEIFQPECRERKVVNMIACGLKVKIQVIKT